MNDNFLKTTNKIFLDVFGRENTQSLSELIEKFAIDIPRPNKRTCALSGDKTWAFVSKNEKVASQKAVANRFKTDGWMRNKRELKNIQDILSSWEEINYITAEKYINSKDVTESDGIYNSNSVYQSTAIFDSKNIIASYKLFDCSDMFASRDNSSCSFGIRMRESIYCSSGFEISWSNKVSRSIFIHDSFDLYECLFCSHIRSKKYCIANMQFKKEEYFALKDKVIDWILAGRSQIA